MRRWRIGVRLSRPFATPRSQYCKQSEQTRATIHSPPPSAATASSSQDSFSPAGAASAASLFSFPPCSPSHGCVGLLHQTKEAVSSRRASCGANNPSVCSATLIHGASAVSLRFFPLLDLVNWIINLRTSTLWRQPSILKPTFYDVTQNKPAIGENECSPEQPGPCPSPGN